MNKRFVAVIVVLVGFTLVTPIVYDYNLDKNVGMRIPSYLSSYPDIGYLKFNPDSIFEALDKGETDVFMPLFDDPNSVESLTTVTFAWTQADYLRIIEALGIFLWDDPMELGDWNIYDVHFYGHCNDSPTGFGYSSLTYFKPTVVDGKKVYTTRHIDIQPYYGMVRWGSGATYPQPILHKWEGFDLADANITAEGTIRILNDHGGDEAILASNNECMIIVDTFRNSTNWSVHYVSTKSTVFFALIDSKTGSYEIISTSQY